MSDRERQDTKMATLYDLRLIFTQGEKKNTQLRKSWNS